MYVGVKVTNVNDLYNFITFSIVFLHDNNNNYYYVNANGERSIFFLSYKSPLRFIVNGVVRYLHI